MEHGCCPRLCRQSCRESMCLSVLLCFTFRLCCMLVRLASSCGLRHERSHVIARLRSSSPRVPLAGAGWNRWHIPERSCSTVPATVCVSEIQITLATTTSNVGVARVPRPGKRLDGSMTKFRSRPTRALRPRTPLYATFARPAPGSARLRVHGSAFTAQRSRLSVHGSAFTAQRSG